MARLWLPIPKVVNGRTLKYDDELANNPPRGRYGSHGIECPCEPNLLLHLCGMLCEYACVEEEDGEFDNGDGRGIKVFEYVKYVKPFFDSIRTRNRYVFTKIIVDSYLSRSLVRTMKRTIDLPMRFNIGIIHAGSRARRMV